MINFVLDRRRPAALALAGLLRLFRLVVAVGVGGRGEAGLQSGHQVDDRGGSGRL